MVNIIFTDLDKTLLNDNHEISERNLDAINFLLEKNNKVIFSSGRSYLNIKQEILDKYHLRLPVSALNGAQVYSESGKLIDSHPIKNNITPDIIDICNKNELFYLLFTESETFANYMPNMMMNLYLLARVKTSDIETIIKGMQIYYDLFYKYKLLDKDTEEEFKNMNKEIYKIEITTHKKDILDDIRKIIPNDLFVTNSSNVNLEITQGEITKANAVKVLCDYYDMSINDAYAIGDNHNDLEMIKIVGHGIAVENAIDEIKEIAEFITNTYDKDGFARFVEYYFKNSI